MHVLSTFVWGKRKRAHKNMKLKKKTIAMKTLRARSWTRFSDDVNLQQIKARSCFGLFMPVQIYTLRRFGFNKGVDHLRFDF